jgi:pyruvate dehydrogenase (quinone)
VVLEVKTDPNVPPLPPHITLKEAKAFAETLIKGDPQESGMLMGAVKQVLSAVLPHGHTDHNDSDGKSDGKSDEKKD